MGSEKRKRESGMAGDRDEGANGTDGTCVCRGMSRSCASPARPVTPSPSPSPPSDSGRRGVWLGMHVQSAKSFSLSPVS